MKVYFMTAPNAHVHKETLLMWQAARYFVQCYMQKKK